MKYLIKSWMSLFLFVLPVQAEMVLTEFTKGRVELVEQKKSYQVEVAQTQAQRALGLMHRSVLPLDTGMLFIYDKTSVKGVWMRDTLIALDVLFLSEDGVIIDMMPHLKPCEAMPCPVYESLKPARYMLELNAGEIEKQKIKTGQQMLFFL
jgi:uncharacterized membrane protein (UPF0127 family)